MENASARYWAFISYSHQDESWARWLHRALETYRIPRRLVGRQTPAGAIPRRLMPIFRDRDEMPSSAELAGTINEALRQSRFQIVICSPHAASSRWVNEEIKTFKRLGRDGRILALIVDGAPNASETPHAGLAECFPHALRHRLDEHGEVGTRKAEVVAADARKGKDGRGDAKLKLIAGLLGVGLDELKQREKIRQRWQWSVRAVATVALIAAVGGLLRVQQRAHAGQERIAHLHRLVDLGRKQADDGEFARAATYLSAAYSEGERSVDVRYLLARALPSVEAMTSRVFRVSDGLFVNQLSYAPDGLHFMLLGRLLQKANIAQLVDMRDGVVTATLEDCPVGGEVHFSPDGRRVLIKGPRDNLGGDPHTDVYDLASGHRLLDLAGYSDAWATSSQLVGISRDSAVRRIAVLNDRGEPEVWDAQTSRKIILPVEDAVSAALSADGSQVVTGDHHGNIVIWDAQSGVMRQRIQAKPAKPTAAFFAANYVTTLGENGAISLWNPETAVFEGVLSGHGSKVVGIQPDASGKRLLTAAENEPARVWDLTGQRTLFTTPERSENYAGFDFSRDDSWLVTLPADWHALKLFSLDSNNLVGTLEGHNGPINGAVSPDSVHLLTVGVDGFVREWDQRVLRTTPLESLAHAATLEKNERNRVAWVGFEQDKIVSAGGDGLVRVWSGGKSDSSQMLSGHSATIDAASLSGDGRRLITGSADHTARVWDLAKARLVTTLSGAHQSRIERVALSVDGKLAATLDFSEPLAHVWNADTGERIATLRGHSAILNAIRFSADGHRVVTASSDKSAKVWDATTGQLLFSLEGHRGNVLMAVPSPDDARIVTVSDDHSARLWSARDGKSLSTITVDDAGALESAAFTYDSKRVAIGADNGMVLLWDLQTGEVRKFTGLDAGYSDAVAFSPDESLVASPSLASGEFGIWSVETGRLLMKWKDPRRFFYTVAFSPDGKRLAAAGPTKDDVADFPVFDVSLETRSPEQIAAVIRCKSPWKVDGERLLPHPPESPNCPGLVEAPH